MLLLALLFGLLPASLSAQKWKKDPDYLKLDQRHQTFLERADLLIKKKERREFMALAEPWQRDDFVKAFWLSLDPFPESSVNEFREMWMARWEVAAEEFGEDVLLRPRAMSFLTQGPPHQKVEDPCSILFWPTEIWIWNGHEKYGRVIGIFNDPGNTGRYRQWTTLDDPAQLIKFPLRPLSENGLRDVQRWLDNPANTGPRPEDNPNDLRNAGSRGARSTFGISDTDSLLVDSQRLYGMLEMMMNDCPGESDIGLLLFEAINQQVTKPNAELTLISPPSDLRDGEGAKRWLEAWQDRSTDVPSSGKRCQRTSRSDFLGAG